MNDAHLVMLLASIGDRQQYTDWLDRLYTIMENENEFNPGEFSSLMQNFE